MNALMKLNQLLHIYMAEIFIKNEEALKKRYNTAFFKPLLQDTF